MSGQVDITRAHPDDAGWVAALIAEAFHPLAVARWLVPDPHQRTRVLQANFRIHVDHVLDHGLVHTTADRSAVAVWLPRDDNPLPQPAAYQQQLAAACGPAAERLQTLDALFDTHHPQAPHHHLAFLAVHPNRQRNGLGSALLTHHHTRLDAHGTAAYLEATSPQSRDLYLRHGYQAAGAPFHLPDHTPIWPMWRPPGRADP